jgi:hypothetical protein
MLCITTELTSSKKNPQGKPGMVSHSELRRLRQEDHMLKACLCYISRPCLKTKQNFKGKFLIERKKLEMKKKKKLLDFKKSHPSIPNEYSTFHGEEQNILQKMIDCL